MQINLPDDFIDYLVVESLKEHYTLCSKPDKIDNSDDIIEPDERLLLSIERILEDYMTSWDFNIWQTEKERSDDT